MGNFPDQLLAIIFVASCLLGLELVFGHRSERAISSLDRIKKEYNCKRATPPEEDDPVAKQEWWYCEGIYVVVIHQEEIER